ncbi:MAG: AAA family ATPase [Dyadobacter fermentans]
MYIKSVSIKNIRSISDFTLEFDTPAGWHVIIGDNGSGKSTVVKSIALALLNIPDINALALDWKEWLKIGSQQGIIELFVSPFPSLSRSIQNRVTIQNVITSDNSKHPMYSISANLREVIFRGYKTFDNPPFLPVSNTSSSTTTTTVYPPPVTTPTPDHFRGSANNMGSFLSEHYGTEYWFSAGYGPFRRFSGGNPDKEKIFKTNPNLGSLLSIFGEDIALTEVLAFLRNQYIEELDARSRGITHKHVLSRLITFINNSNLLPHGATIAEVTIEGVFFKDGYGNKIESLQMSDGYRSILCLTFELIRQLIRNYGAEKVFSQIDAENYVIDLPGVVIIDEIDAHLHPTWQTKIGTWFTKYFPNLQFIVTTHSPLICRASEKGTIWRLAAPGSENESGQVLGDDRNKLVYGNVLDAYGTEIFGSDVSISNNSVEKKEELVKLSKKKLSGKISETEEIKLKDLRKIFSTDDQIDL